MVFAEISSPNFFWKHKIALKLKESAQPLHLFEAAAWISDATFTPGM